MMNLQNSPLRNLLTDPLTARSSAELRSGNNSSTSVGSHANADPAGFASLLRQSQMGVVRPATAPLQNVAALTAPAPAPNPSPASAPIRSAQIATAAPHAQPLAPPPQAVKSSATPRTPTTATATASDSDAAGASAAPTAARSTAAGKPGAAARRSATPAKDSSGKAGSDGSEAVVADDAHPRAAQAKQPASDPPTGEPTPPWLADLQRRLTPATATDANGAALTARGMAAGALGTEARGPQVPVLGDASNTVSNASAGAGASASAGAGAPAMRAAAAGADLSRDLALPGARDITKDSAIDSASRAALDVPLSGAAAISTLTLTSTAPAPVSVGANANANASTAAGVAALLGDPRGVDPATFASLASNPPGRAGSGSGDANALTAAITSAAATAANALQSRNLQGVVAPSVVRLAAAVTEPEFAQALGVQISVLASAGVQRAELHLNPADMGPVSVQIILDGTQARVDFGADVAATRAAIEAGLPALAAALSDAGFTLSGGGVSQHSRGRSDAQDASQSQSQSQSKSASDSQRRTNGAPGDDASIGSMRAGGQRTVTLGGLDLYA